MKPMDMLKRIVALGALTIHLSACQGGDPSPYVDWKVYGGSPDDIHYSSLRQINRDNVQQLRVAWTYDSEDAFPDS